jgi:hypothetical protein
MRTIFLIAVAMIVVNMDISQSRAAPKYTWAAPPNMEQFKSNCAKEHWRKNSHWSPDKGDQASWELGQSICMAYKHHQLPGS